ncbi:MAG: D-glycero-beta-D-manno-heptose 1,7-bisphosphate 7-phosphatase [Gammaproteobacteria bacterium]
MSRRLIILDRDGVINHDSDAFIKSPDEWRPIEGSADAIGALSAAGFTVAVASNQSGIARNLFDRRTLYSIHDKMRRVVRAHGGDIDRIVFCPHGPGDGCDCRKPEPGMLLKLSHHYGVPLDRVPVIGDSLRDLDAALAVNARPILVLTGKGKATAAAVSVAGRQVEVFADLGNVATALIAEETGA